MKFQQSALLVLALLSFGISTAAEEVSVQYEYTGNSGRDFSKMTGSFQVGSFSDDRAGADANLITKSDLGTGNGGYTADESITALIQDAFVQAFTADGAEMAGADAEIVLNGKLLSAEAQLIERDGAQLIQLTMRVNVQVLKNGSSAWQVTLFGRGRTPVADGMAVTVRASLDRMIRELINDDYFLQQVI